MFPNTHSVAGARTISHLVALRWRVGTSADSDFGPSIDRVMLAAVTLVPHAADKVPADPTTHKL